VGITIYNEVVGEFRNSGCKIYLRFVFELVGHGDTLDTLHFAISELTLDVRFVSTVLTHKEGAKARLS
jgi:hypothetical protein